MPDPKYKNLSKEDSNYLTAQDYGALVGFLGSRAKQLKEAKKEIGKGYPTASKYGKGGKVRVKKSRVNEAGNYTKPGMRKRIFERIKAGSKGGRPGQWSARKAQMVASEYKKAGGGYTS